MESEAKITIPSVAVVLYCNQAFYNDQQCNCCLLSVPLIVMDCQNRLFKEKSLYCQQIERDPKGTERL